MERQGLHLRFRYGLPGRIFSLVKFGFDPKAGGRSRTADQVDNGLKCTRQLQKISTGESVQPEICGVSCPMWRVAQVHHL